MSLFKKPKWLIRKEKEAARRLLGKPRTRRKGETFEKTVVKRFNSVTGSGNIRGGASRCPASGALWAFPGDVVTPDALFECKERGTTTSRGAKTITIHLEWLQKIAQEAAAVGKSYWALPFAFKGHDDIYIIKNYNDELTLLTTLDRLLAYLHELTGDFISKGDVL